MLSDDFRKEPPFPPDFLFLDRDWSGVGDLEALRGLERRLAAEDVIPLSYLRLHGRLGFALLTMDMQHRWRNAYQATLKTNRELLGRLLAAADAGPMVLVGGLAMLCGVHPDPGTRPLPVAEVLGTGAEGVAALLALPRPLDTAAASARAVRVAPVREEPVDDAPVLEFIPQVDIAQPPPGVKMDRPEIMRKLERGERAELEALAAHPNVRMLAPHDALLLAAVRTAGGRGMKGLEWWELSEMCRRLDPDWKALESESRRLGLAAVTHRLLTTLATTWRSPVPQSTLTRLTPNPLLAAALKMATPGSKLESLLLGL